VTEILGVFLVSIRTTTKTTDLGVAEIATRIGTTTKMTDLGVAEIATRIGTTTMETVVGPIIMNQVGGTIRAGHR
jgi:hypothetical protein